jgi:nucleolar protein 53
MPKNNRGKRKKNRKREWRKIEVNEQLSDSSKVDPALVLYNKATENPNLTQDSLFIVDKKGSATTLSSNERKLKARNKILFVQRGLLPADERKMPPRKRKMNGQDKKYVEKLTKNTDNENPQKKRKIEDGSLDFKSIEYFDIWEKEKDPLDAIIAENPSLEKGYLMEMEKKKINPPKRVKNNNVEAVEIVEPGASYNPSKEDHEVLLKKAVDEQMKRRKEFYSVMKKVKVENQKETKEIKELHEFSSSDEEVDDNTDDNTTNEHVNIPIIPRLTIAERNRQKRRKAHEAIVKKNKLDKKRDNDDIRSIIVDAKKDKLFNEQIIKERKRKIEEKNLVKTKRVGKEKLGERDIEVLLSDQLPDSLRNFTPSSSLLEDRFHSLQKRNIIETRSYKNYQRRYPIKLKVNIRHREFTNEQEKTYK